MPTRSDLALRPRRIPEVEDVQLAPAEGVEGVALESEPRHGARLAGNARRPLLRLAAAPGQTGHQNQRRDRHKALAAHLRPPLLMRFQPMTKPFLLSTRLG